MNLIDYTYFIGDIYLPNLNKDNELSSLDVSIEKYEKECLLLMLGYELYAELLTILEDGEPYPDPWEGLINGDVYDLVCNNITYKSVIWPGLVNEQKVSPLSYFIYYKHRLINATDTAGIGEITGIGENAERALMLNKSVRAFNNFVLYFGNVPAGFTQGYIYNIDPSAYNYLSTNMDDFTNWLFTKQTTINEFNI